MKLKKLDIELNWYGEFKGQYVGKVEFEDEKENKVCMALSPAVSNLVLATLGDNLAALTKRTADNLTASIRQSIAEAKSPAVALPAPGTVGDDIPEL